MKRMKNKKLNQALIAGTLSMSIVLGIAGVGLLNHGFTSSAIDVMALESNYNIVSNKEDAKTYYVSPDVSQGSEGADGTEEHPYSLVDILNDESPLKAGDTVLLLPGTYVQNTRIRLQRKSGTFDGYITVKNASDTEKAIIDFSNMTFDSLNRGVQLDTDYWYWYGIDITGAGDNGMYIGGSYNVIENCEFYRNRDTGLQLGRSESDYSNINDWPSYNLIKNCTSYNNYDNETYGENADGFAAKLTVGYGNIFDGCIAYRNSDDGWDLYAKTDSGNIGAVIMYNCVAFENGYIAETQAEFNARFPNYNTKFNEVNTNSYLTKDGDGNGFKLGGSVMEGDVYLYNCLSFNNRMHGVTDNSNPGVLSVKNVTAYNNSAGIDNDPSSQYFGHITLGSDGINADSLSGNINMARQTYSYNLMSGIVSVNKDLKTVLADEYRGSAEYSYFDMVNGKAYKFEDCVDASQRSEDYAQKGESVNAISADIFEMLPVNWTDGTDRVYTYNLTGKENSSVHATYRNEDGSINMKDILRITDYSTLFGDSHKIGADLTGNTWEDYTHYNYFNASNAESEEDAAVKSAIATLDLNTNVNATFQDFDLVVSMEDVNITWVSSDSAIVINTDTPVSPSGTQDARAIVYRGSTDKKVTLTATVTSKKDSGLSMEKTFEITVKADVPTIGEAVFEGVEEGRIIIDMFDDMTEPAMTVRNAADYSGKLLEEDVYSVNTKVEYGIDKTAYPVQIHHFTTSVTGVYYITKDITLGDVTKTFTYTAYVASANANVGFVGSPVVTVNQYGYTIAGEVSSAIGKLYSYSSATPVENITSDFIIENGKGYDFRNDAISFQYDNDNSAGYYVYYVLCNASGKVTSEIGCVEVEAKEITDINDFKAMMLENNSSSIYMLKSNLDLSGEKNWVAEITSNKKSFLGLLNGLGHTISNFTVSASSDEQAALFYRLAGGTVENIKFENFNINGCEKNKVGIFATTYGGYIYNVEMRNIVVSGGQRVGALIGQIMNGTLYVDQVSLVNDAVYVEATVSADKFGEDTYFVKNGEEYIKATEYDAGAKYYLRRVDIAGTRSGGIVGDIQASSTNDYTRSYISNCYIDATIGSSELQFKGSIAGRFDDRNPKDYLEITHCYSVSILYGRTYVGGILGSQNTGAGVIRISNCVFNGLLYYGQNVTALTSAEKNCSGIVGRYSGNADAQVKLCFARFEDHNSNYDVDNEAFTLGRVNLVTFWSTNVGFSQEKWSYILNPDREDRVLAPYVTLNFLGNWD